VTSWPKELCGIDISTTATVSSADHKTTPSLVINFHAKNLIHLGINDGGGRAAVMVHTANVSAIETGLLLEHQGRGTLRKVVQHLEEVARRRYWRGVACPSSFEQDLSPWV
jgi:hypothetical protein